MTGKLISGRRQRCDSSASQPAEETDATGGVDEADAADREAIDLKEQGMCDGKMRSVTNANAHRLGVLLFDDDAVPPIRIRHSLKQDCRKVVGNGASLADCHNWRQDSAERSDRKQLASVLTSLQRVDLCTGVPGLRKARHVSGPARNRLTFEVPAPLGQAESKPSGSFRRRRESCRRGLDPEGLPESHERLDLDWSETSLRVLFVRWKRAPLDVLGSAPLWMGCSAARRRHQAVAAYSGMSSVF